MLEVQGWMRSGGHTGLSLGPVHSSLNTHRWGHIRGSGDGAGTWKGSHVTPAISGWRTAAGIDIPTGGTLSVGVQMTALSYSKGPCVQWARMQCWGADLTGEGRL